MEVRESGCYVMLNLLRMGYWISGSRKFEVHTDSITFSLDLSSAFDVFY